MIFWRNKIQKNRTHEEALHHPSPLARKLKRTESTTKHYTTGPFPLVRKTQKNRTHDQALHHPSPLARKTQKDRILIHTAKVGGAIQL
jgi:hypothetical protein